MISIHAEIEAIANGKTDRAKQYAQKRAAHCAAGRVRKMGSSLLARTSGVSGAMDTRTQILASCRRIDSVYGDRNLFCTCPPMEEFEGLKHRVPTSILIQRRAEMNLLRGSSTVSQHRY